MLRTKMEFPTVYGVRHAIVRDSVVKHKNGRIPSHSGWLVWVLMISIDSGVDYVDFGIVSLILVWIMVWCEFW